MPNTDRVRYGEPLQLELSLFGDRSLRAVIDAFMARETEGLSDATIEDYRDRFKWVLREFGGETDVNDVTFDEFDRIARRHRGILRQVTIKKRFVLLRAAMKLAKKRRILKELPELPRLQNDGEVKNAIHTVAQWEVFRMYLPAGATRRFYDLAFWTGMHTADLFKMTRGDLDLYRPILDEKGEEVSRGAFLRCNQKNAMAPLWMPMQPELAMVAREILIDVQGPASTFLVGRVWSLRRTFHMAADRAVADGLDMPRVSPIDLRRSFASMLTGRGFPLEYVRIALGHKGPVPVGWAPGQHMARKPTTASAHYMRPTPALLATQAKP